MTNNQRQNTVITGYKNKKKTVTTVISSLLPGVCDDSDDVTIFFLFLDLAFFSLMSAFTHGQPWCAGSW